MFRRLLVVLFVLVAATSDAQPLLPERAAAVVDQLYARNLDLAQGDDDQRRALTRKIIEQIVCEFPNEGYSWKASSPTNPPSKDAIAKADGGRLWAWDWQNGASREPQTYPGKPADHDITGQHPIPLSCVDHLGTAEPEPQPTPAPPSPSELLDEVKALHVEFDTFKAEVRAEWVVQAERDARTYESIEAHRKEARETKNTVLAFLTDWKTLAKIGIGVAGTIIGTR